MLSPSVAVLERPSLACWAGEPCERGHPQGTGTRGVSQCQGSVCHRRGLRGPVREDPEGAQAGGV